MIAGSSSNIKLGSRSLLPRSMQTSLFCWLPPIHYRWRLFVCPSHQKRRTRRGPSQRIDLRADNSSSIHESCSATTTTTTCGLPSQTAKNPTRRRTHTPCRSDRCSGPYQALPVVSFPTGFHFICFFNPYTPHQPLAVRTNKSGRRRDISEHHDLESPRQRRAVPEPMH